MKNISILFGLFCWTISLFAQPVNDDCSDAILMVPGDTVVVDLLGATSDTGLVECAGLYFYDTVGVWLKFIGTGGFVKIDVTSQSHAEAAVMVFSEACGNLQCEEDIVYTYDQPSTFQTILDRVYFLHVRDRYGYSVGKYSMSITEVELADNSICANAQQLFIGDTVYNDYLLGLPQEVECRYSTSELQGVWYSFIGNGENLSIWFKGSYELSGSILIYDGDCDSLHCQLSDGIWTEYKSPYLTTELNKEYYVFLGVYPGTELSDLLISVNSNPIALNIDSSDAAIIDCGQEDTIYTNAGVYQSYDDEAHFWYTFVGNGGGYRLSNVRSSSTNYSINVYEEGTLIIEGLRSTGYDETETFFGEGGHNYLLEFVISRRNSEGEISFNLECFELLENDNCSGAIDLSCTNFISANTYFATPSIINSNCGSSNPDLWYSFLGTGQNILIRGLPGEIYNVNFKVYQNTCESLTCISSYTLRDNSSIEFFLQSGVQYYFALSTAGYYSGSGLFNAQVFCIPNESNDNCQEAELIESNVIYTVDLGNTSPEEIACLNGARGVWYELPDLTDTILEIINFSNTSYQATILSGNCTNLTCDQSFQISGNGRISIVNPSEHDYLFLTGTTANVSFYTVYQSLAENNHCIDASQVDCGDTLTGRTTMASSSIGSPNCTELATDLWYVIDGTGEFFEFDLLSTFGSVRLEVFTSCMSNADCFFSEWLYAYDQRNVRFLSNAHDTYYIRIVDQSNFYIASNFEISLSCHEVAINNTCAESIPIISDTIIKNTTVDATSNMIDNSCGYGPEKDIWYSIAGNDSICKFFVVDGSLELYIGDCMNLECIASTNDYLSKKLDAGINYYVRLFNSNSYYGNNSVEAQLFFFTPMKNDECEMATLVSCGDIIDVNMFLATNGDDASCINGRPDIWYTLIGNDSIIKIEYSGVENSGYLNVSIFDGSCTELNCIRSGYLDYNDREFRFNSVQGTPYYINFNQSSYRINMVDFPISISCQEPATNDECEGAIEVSIYPKTINAQLTNASTSPSCYGHNDPDLWYKVMGNGEILRLSGLTSNSYTRIEVFIGQCNSLDCFQRFQLYGTESTNILLEDNVPYYFLLSGNYGDSISVVMDVYPPVPGSLVDIPIRLSCGDTAVVHQSNYIYQADQNCYSENITWLEINLPFSGKLNLFSSEYAELYSSYNEYYCSSYYLGQGQEFNLDYNAGEVVKLQVYNHTYPVEFRLQCPNAPIVHPCQSDLSLTSQSIPNINIDNGVIQSIGKMDLQDITVQDTADMYWQSAHSINIYPEFMIEQNANIHMRIDSCYED